MKRGVERTNNNTERERERERESDRKEKRGSDKRIQEERGRKEKVKRRVERTNNNTERERGRERERVIEKRKEGVIKGFKKREVERKK